MTDAAETSPFWCARLVPEHAAAVWEFARPLLEPAIRRGDGFFTSDDVRERVTAPDAGSADGWSLWILGEAKRLRAAWVTVPAVFPRARVLHVPFAGGRGMDRWYATALAETEKFARETGCDRLQCAGRDGWERRGYRRVATLFERTL